MRLALYLTPPADHPLVAAAEAWLGRSAFARDVAGVAVAGHTPEERAALVAEPARYGFHGTLKAPFRLADGCSPEDVAEALEAYGRARAAPPPVPLAVTRLGGFLALTPAAPAPGLDALAADLVRRFEPFRAPLTEAEMAKRRPERLTPTQRAHLADWGYPYVFEDFRFHMTLTGPLDAAEAEALRPALTGHFAAALAEPLVPDRVGLFQESEATAPFTCIRLVRLAGGEPASS